MIDDVKLKEEVFMLKQHHGLLLHTMSNPLQDLCQAHTELEVGNADRLIFVLFALIPGPNFIELLKARNNA